MTSCPDCGAPDDQGCRAGCPSIVPPTDFDQLALLLRLSRQSLEQAVRLVDLMPDEAIAAPGRGYLLGRLETALDIIEMELPEYRSIAAEQITRRVLDGLTGGGLNEK